MGKGLAASSIREWLDLVSREGMGPQLAEQVIRATNGNPFFVRELVLAWVHEGGLDRKSPAQLGSENAIVVPPNVRGMVEQRLDAAERLG